MSFWATLWQCVFVVGVGAFAVMALWVTVQGARDIKALLTALRDGHAQPPDRSDIAK